MLFNRVRQEKNLYSVLFLNKDFHTNIKKVTPRREFFMENTLNRYEILSFLRNKDVELVDRDLEIHDFNLLIRF